MEVQRKIKLSYEVYSTYKGFGFLGSRSMHKSEHAHFLSVLMLFKMRLQNGLNNGLINRPGAEQ